MTLVSVAAISLTLALQGLAATVTQTLPIVNKNISPDGFNRSSVIAYPL
jgi:hypothetical protein